jgi:pimeloyl-ACP methyl ester carboxylesterase
LATVAEAGFFELAGGDYVSEGQARVSPGQRIWYSFQPATTTPESKPLAVFFNGGPGSATSAYLFSFNTGPWTLDPAATGSRPIVANPNNWAQFANLLYVDAPGTGFSYPISLDGGAQPSVGIDLDRDAAAVIRVVIRFLDRHIPLQSNPVILVGESYGGTRAALMLDRLFNYQLLATTGAAYQDAGLYSDLLQHFAAVFPQQDSRKLSPQQIAAQFGHQVLIEPVVAGQNQWSLNNFDRSVCVANYDVFQCDQPAGWSDQTVQVAVTHLTTIATLRQALGVDPTTIDWLHASARTRAYGRGEGSIVDAPEMTATFGTLGAQDSYFLIRNTVAGYKYSSDSRWWTDSAIGVSFLNDVVYVKTFITNARLDMDVWAPAIPVALGEYPSLVSSSVYDAISRTGVARAGWIRLDYLPSVASNPTTREIRFPSYATAGHAVTMRASGELLTDVVQWYTNVSASPVAHSSPPAPPFDSFPGTSREISPARPLSEPFPDMGP